jgi:regulatory protein
LARRALAQELGRRGIDREVLDGALAEVTDEDELITARALVARRVQTTRGLSVEARVRRLTSLLARKGYSAGVARTVVREALEAESAAENASLGDVHAGEQLDRLFGDD